MSKEILVPCETVEIRVSKAFLERIRLNPHYSLYSGIEDFIIDAMRYRIEQLEKVP